MSIPAVTVPSPFKQKFDSPQDRTGVCGREMKISRSSQVYEAAERQGSRSLPVGPPMFPNLTVTNWVRYRNPHVLSRILCSHVTVNIFLIPSCVYRLYFILIPQSLQSTTLLDTTDLLSEAVAWMSALGITYWIYWAQTPINWNTFPLSDTQKCSSCKYTGRLDSFPLKKNATGWTRTCRHCKQQCPMMSWW